MPSAVARARAVILGSAFLALPACDRGPKTPAAVSVAPATATDWSKVQPADQGNAILAYKTIARYCDGWYAGEKQVVTFHFVPPTSIKDDSGNAVDLGALYMNEAVWKSIIQMARAGDPNAQPIEAVASKSEFYKPQSSGGRAGDLMPVDDFGVIPRFRYRLECVNDQTLTLRNVGKFDDGV